MTQRYLRNTFYSLFFFALQSLVTLLASPAIIRTLGKESYGIIVAVNTLSAFGWLSLMDLGLEGALTKHLADAFREGEKGREKAALLFQSALTLYLGCGIVAGILVASLSLFPTLFSVSPRLYPLISRALIVVAAFNVVIFPLLTVAAVVEGLQEYRSMKTLGGLVLLGWAVAVFFLVQARAGVLSFLVADFLKTALQYGLLVVLVKRKLPWLKIRAALPDLRELKAMASLSLDLFVSRITGMVFNQTDVLIITLVLGQLPLVTDYYSANALFAAALSVASVFNKVVISEAAWAHREGSSQGVLGVAVVGTRLTAAYVFPLAAAIFVWAPDILNVWLGPEFVKNEALLRMLMLALIPLASSGVTSTLLVGIDKVRGSLWIPLLSIFINLLISVAGVRSFGILALGLGTTTAHFIGSWLFNRYCLRILQAKASVFYLQTLAKPLTVTLLCAVAALFLRSMMPVSDIWKLVTAIGGFLTICYGSIFLCCSDDMRVELLTVIGLQRFSPKRT